MPQQSRIVHPEQLYKKRKFKIIAKSLSWKNWLWEHTERKEGKKKKSGFAGTLLFIVQYFTESTKASSVLTRIVL